VVFIDLYLDVPIFDHLPTTVISNNKPFFGDIFNGVFENKRILNIFDFFIEAIHIEKIVR